MEAIRGGDAAVQRRFHFRQACPQRGELAADLGTVVVLPGLLGLAQATAKEQALLPRPGAEFGHRAAEVGFGEYAWRGRGIGLAHEATALLGDAQQRQAHRIGPAAVGDQARGGPPDQDRFRVLATGQVRHRLAHLGLQATAQRQHLAAAAEGVDGEVDGGAGGGRFGDGGADIQLQGGAVAGLQAHRQTVGEDGLQGQHADEAGTERGGVEFELAEPPEPGVGGVAETGGEDFGAQSLQLEMLGQQLHALVPADCVRQHVHTTPLRHP